MTYNLLQVACKVLQYLLKLLRLRLCSPDLLERHVLVIYCSQVYVAMFKRLGWTKSKVSLLTDDSSGEYPVYHSKMNNEFKKQGITLAAKELLPKMKYLFEDFESDCSKPSPYAKVGLTLLIRIVKNIDSKIKSPFLKTTSSIS